MWGEVERAQVYLALGPTDVERSFFLHRTTYFSPVPNTRGAASATPLGAAVHRTIMIKLGALSGR